MIAHAAEALGDAGRPDQIDEGDDPPFFARRGEAADDDVAAPAPAGIGVAASVLSMLIEVSPAPWRRLIAHPS